MEYEVYWYIPGKVLVTRIWGEFNAEDMYAVTLATQEEYTRAPENVKVHLISDLRGVRMTPQTLQDIRRHFPGIAYPNLGWFLVVSSNKLIQFLSIALMQVLYPQLRSRAFTSMDGALAFIRGYVESDEDTRPSLDSLE